VRESDCVFKLSWEGFAALCRDLAERVAADYQPDLVVGIARGGTLPGALLALLLRRDFHPLRVPLRTLPRDLPSYLPDRRLVAGRRVLLVDERAPDGAALRWAVEALRRLGAREVRTLLLFGSGGATADYSGPQVDVLVIQPWIQDTVLPSPTKAPAGGSSP
jgi:hypoxanthine phosphoribosyltransferase